MKTAPLLVLVALVAIASGLATQFVFAPASSDGSASDGLSQEVASLRARLALVDGAQRRMENSLGNIESLLGARPEVSAAISDADIRRAVEAVFEDQMADTTCFVEGASLVLTGPQESVQRIETGIRLLRSTMVRHVKLRATLYGLHDGRELPSRADAAAVESLTRGLSRLWSSQLVSWVS